ncbi:hypothetical protein U1708_00190 [Sphingomonas sp. ZB1N12]
MLAHALAGQLTALGHPKSSQHLEYTYIFNTKASLIHMAGTQMIPTFALIFYGRF